MRALQLSFAAAPPLRTRVAGVGLLLLAALAAAGTAHRHEQLQAQLDTLQAQQARLLARVGDQRAPAGGVAAGAADAQTQRRLAQARAVIEPLAVPWERLFAALESVPTRTVQLQELVPDAQAHTLRLSGRAPSLPVVLGYLDRLAEQPLLGQVHLVSTQPAVQEGATALSFTLLATWRTP